MVSRLVIAGGLGAFVGLERELRGYPAGIRTLAIVALGSALFTDMSGLFTDDQSTSRIASQVVVGIGFLGAGVILQERGGVRGMTTAATIWAAAAIGMATGLSLYVVAVLAAVSVFVLLEARVLTRRIDALLRNAHIDLREEDDGSDAPMPQDEPTNEDQRGSED